jgi:hypothetical protein
MLLLERYLSDLLRFFGKRNLRKTCLWKEETNMNFAYSHYNTEISMFTVHKLKRRNIFEDKFCLMVSERALLIIGIINRYILNN